MDNFDSFALGLIVGMLCQLGLSLYVIHRIAHK